MSSKLLIYQNNIAHLIFLFSHCMQWVFEKDDPSLRSDISILFLVSLVLQAYLILLCFTVLHFTDVFLQIEGKAFHQHDNHNLLYCETDLTAVMWNQTAVLLRQACTYQSLLRIIILAIFSMKLHYVLLILSIILNFLIF